MIWRVSAQNWFVLKKKIKKFPEFRSIEPVFQSIEIAIKNFGQPLSILIDAQLILVQSKHFRSIEPNFRSIENCIKSFSNLIFTCSNFLSKSFQNFLSLYDSIKASIKFFCRFSLPRPVRPLYPSFCIYLHVSCVKSCDFGKISNLKILGVIWWFNLFLLKLINGSLF